MPCHQQGVLSWWASIGNSNWTKVVRTVYIGIDDTDNLETRGTGFRARQLMQLLEAEKLGKGLGITRHQLLFDKRVPYTSHNSSACLALKGDSGIDELADLCREFLLSIAAIGSDVGLCVADEVQALRSAKFGQKAKVDLVTQQQAREVAEQLSILLEGLTGDHQGIIGALSAVGLHVEGNDGRYIWGRGLRDFDNQIMTLRMIKEKTNIDKVALLDGSEIVCGEVQIHLGPWPRTVRLEKQAVLLVERLSGNDFKVLDKEIIKSIHP